MRIAKGATRAISVFAFNNEVIDYGALAVLSAKLISKNMYCEALQIFTDETTLEKHEYAFNRLFDKIVVLEPKLPRETGTLRPYYYDGGYKQATYYNTYRTDIFDLTEFDENIVLDVDYMVLSSKLNSAWGSEHDFLINKDFAFVMDFGRSHKCSEQIRLSDTSIPMRWATVFYFRKSDKTARLFEIAKEVSEKYRFYSLVYGFKSGQYRNDYIFSVADHVMGGYTKEGYSRPLPDKTMIMTKRDHEVYSLEGGSTVFVAGEDGTASVASDNVHVMNKESLMKLSSGYYAFGKSK